MTDPLRLAKSRAGEPRPAEDRHYDNAVKLLARVSEMALTLDSAVQRILRGQDIGPDIDYGVLSRALHDLLPKIHAHTRRQP
jgi:hypothetical protein